MRRLFYIILMVVVAASTSIYTSCTKKRGEPKMYGDRVFTRAELAAITGWPESSFNKYRYLALNKEWAVWHHAQWRKDFSEGWASPTRWTPDVLCTTFTTLFTGSIAKEFFRHSFHDFIPEGVEGVIAIEYWYRTDRGGNHAITAFVDESGILWFIEPQTLPGHNPLVRLSSAEIRNHLRVKSD